MKNDAAKYLSVRFHSEHEEHARIVSFHRSKKEEKPDDNSSFASGRAHLNKKPQIVEVGALHIPGRAFIQTTR